MNNDVQNKLNDTRKISDVLLSIENKLTTLIQMVANSDANNKLILSRLNKSVITPISNLQQSLSSNTNLINEQIIEVSQQPTVSKRNSVKTNNAVKSVIEESNVVQAENLLPNNQISNAFKIPVGQRITDHTGKDLFMADVIITDISSGQVINKLKTNAVGKWQAYLSTGKYIISVSKITDASTMHKIEATQEIEITKQMKSLLLPVAIIKR